jgi:hypothetical protein
MVTWKNPQAYYIRRMAADLLRRLVKSNRYGIRVASVSGPIEGIFSLLISDADKREMLEMMMMMMMMLMGSDPGLAATAGDRARFEYNLMDLRIAGIRILKNLAKDPLNSARIGATRGLLTRLVTFVGTTESTFVNRSQYLQVVQVTKSLQLLNLLAATPGSAGKTLRQDIARIVFTISNLRSILEHGEAHPALQLHAAELLLSLGMEENVQCAIGRTGGVIRCLLKVFLKERVNSDKAQIPLVQKAGEALSLIALKNEENCERMARLRVKPGGVVVPPEDEEDDDKEEDHDEGSRRDAGGSSKRGILVAEALLRLVPDWNVGDVAMNILRSFFAYGKSDDDDDAGRRKIVEMSTRKVMKLTKERSGKGQVAAMGLLAKLVARKKLDIGTLMKEEGIEAEHLVKRLKEVLERNLAGPVAKLPMQRRNAVELVAVMVEHHGPIFRDLFVAAGFRSLLRHLSETVSDMEDYATFSGAAGVTSHSVNMSALVDQAIGLL